MESELEKKARKKAEREKKRQEARENAEKKKRFTLTPEKKRKLKLLIMKKAAEDLENEAREKAEAKRKYIEEKVKPLPDVSHINEAQLVALCKELHKNIVEMENSKYDLEMKIRKHDYELNELTIKVNDSKGKFVKPQLNKVSKTKNQFAKIEKKDDGRDAIKASLKSSGKSKFALEEEKDDHKVDFRKQIQKEGEAAEE